MENIINLKVLIHFMVEESKKEVNPYLEKIFGEWFKNVVLLLLLIPMIFILIWGVIVKWIDQSFAIDFLFLLLGIYIGKWFENGKK